MPNHEIRLLHPDELERVVHVWRRAREDAQPWLEARMRMHYGTEDDLVHFRDSIARENDVWLAVDGERILGFLAISSTRVNYLYVDPPAQNQGIGSALLDRAKALSPQGLTLFTHQRNARARTFYEHRGFRAVQFGVSPAPESEPDVQYAWEPMHAPGRLRRDECDA